MTQDVRGAQPPVVGGGAARKIIHVDMDAFYASVEQLDNPALRGRPIAVGGDASRRGVIATASYEARRFGVRSAMPTRTALRLCPDLVLVPARFDRYREVSAQVQAIFGEFTELFEPVSLDEAYLDVSDSPLMQGSATLIAAAIRERIQRQTGLTASAGVAPNKFLAKVASDWKKPDGMTVVRPEQVPQFVQTLPVRRIPGVGAKGQQALAELAVSTCADLQRLSLAELQDRFGRWGTRLFNLSRGVDDRPVRRSRPRKQISVEETFAQDVHDNALLLHHLQRLHARMTERVAKSNRRIRGASLKVRFGDFQTQSIDRACAFVPDVDSYWDMLSEVTSRRPEVGLRLLGVGVRLHVDEGRQLSLPLDEGQPS